VSKSLGCLNLSGSTEQYLLPRNHFNINKFGRPDEEDYQILCEVVAKMVENAPGILQSRMPSQGMFKHRGDYVGRC
jgi:hypothetical protein